MDYKTTERQHIALALWRFGADLRNTSSGGREFIDHRYLLGRGVPPKIEAEVPAGRVVYLLLVKPLYGLPAGLRVAAEIGLAEEPDLRLDLLGLAFWAHATEENAKGMEVVRDDEVCRIYKLTGCVAVHDLGIKPEDVPVRHLVPPALPKAAPRLTLREAEVVNGARRALAEALLAVGVEVRAAWDDGRAEGPVSGLSTTFFWRASRLNPPRVAVEAPGKTVLILRALRGDVEAARQRAEAAGYPIPLDDAAHHVDARARLLVAVYERNGGAEGAHLIFADDTTHLQIINERGTALDAPLVGGAAATL